MNPRKDEETMKTVILTPNSSVKSSVTVESSPSETRDSSYFPGCRKDANCNCEICIASINATLDLMPHSTRRRSSLSKFSTSKKISISKSPVSFNPSAADLSSPKSCAISPPRIRVQEKVKRRKEEDSGYRVLFVRIFWGLILIFSVEYGVSWMVSGVLRGRLSADAVKNLGSKSRDFEGLSRKFLFLKNELEGLIGKEVSSCTSANSMWKISQDDLLLNSQCVLYKSMMEEVSVWGWPLQTAGLLAAEHSSRSFTVISGRVTQWFEGETRYLVREPNNSSWAQGKWTASVVQFDPNTWILEYRQSFLMDNIKLVSAVVEFLKFRLTREFKKMKREFWLVPAFGSQHFGYTRGMSIPAPT